MEKLRKFFTSVPGILLIFVLAAVPLFIGSIGSARAALTYYSDTYLSEMSMKRIGVTLYDNGAPAEKISNKDYTGDGTWDENTGYLLKNTFLDENGNEETPKFGKKYRKNLNVLNSGDIDIYVRATVYKYWYRTDESGNEVKDYTLSPDLIQVGFLESNGWHIDTASTTAERTVLYYDKVLKNGEMSPDFIDGLIIDGNIQNNFVVTNDGNGNITTAYKYNGSTFLLQVDLDAVQDHNAEAAIKSAWGWDVTINNGTLKKD